MQQRYFFAAVGYVRPRRYTSLVKPRNCTEVSGRGKRAYHGTPMWHRSSIRDFHNIFSVHTRLKHSHIYSGGMSRCMNIGTIARQEDPMTSLDPREITLSTETKSMGCTETDLSAKVPPTENVLKWRYVWEDPKKKLHTRSNSEGNSTHQSFRNLPKRYYPRVETALASWLDMRRRSRRAAIWENRSNVPITDFKNFTLPMILLFYLETTETTTPKITSLAAKLALPAFPALQRSGFGPEDVREWARILLAPTDEEVAQRYLNSPLRTPTFLLLEVLRRPHLSPDSFRSLFVRSLSLPGIRPDSLLSDSTSEATDIVPAGPKPQLSSPAQPAGREIRSLDEHSFELLCSHLSRHACRVWPAALDRISIMVVSYCDRLVGNELRISPRTHARLCKIYNLMLRRFSLPASINPMLSMTHNWQAQRRLLISAGEFQPPLQLDKSAYRAVAQVLLASKKSPAEAHYASLMQRTWPPWRKELDGMDMSRSPDSDVSRVVASLSRMKEAGYPGDEIDGALQILGGRELDGTPTVQTRQLTQAPGRRLPQARRVPTDASSEDSRVEWTARIVATRDVHEAWEAFQGFKGDGQPPSESMYTAMFQKLIYKTLTDPSRQDPDIIAGDTMAPLPALDDNITQSEKLRIRPPSLGDLFQRMIRDGIRPRGRCLEMLITHAASLEQVALYLRHGAVRSNTLAELLRRPAEMRSWALESIPYEIFKAFVRFLCRPRRFKLTNPSGKFGAGESVVHFELHLDPVLHAFELVRRRQPSTLFLWHIIFRAFTQPELFLNYTSEHYGNDGTSWRFLEASVGECLERGFAIEPDGFRLICIGLENSIVASPHIWKSTGSRFQNSAKLVKGIFAKLTETVETGYALPRLLHRVVGYHLHSYIRVLGHMKDIDEVMIVLEWMVKHQDVVTTNAKESRNGLQLLRRSLVAVRVFFGWNEAEEEVVSRLKALMCQLDEWGGWPTDAEVMQYVANGETSKLVGDGELEEKEQEESYDRHETKQ